jgi:hypothetical protein
MNPVGFEPTISAGKRPQTYDIYTFQTVCEIKRAVKSRNFNLYFKKKIKKKNCFLTELQITKELRDEVKPQILMQIKLFTLVSSIRRFGRILLYVGRKFVG